MTAFIRIDQDGLPDGEAGRSRTDGKADGSLVTLTDTSSGGTTLFKVPWTPPGDATARASLGATVDPKVWTFEPTAGKYGSYAIELVRNAGLLSETVEARVLVMRTPNRGLVIPALNERGNRNASLDAPDLDVANNAVDYPDADLNAVPSAAWWRAIHELIMSVDASGGAATSPAVDLVFSFADIVTDEDPGAGLIRFDQSNGGGGGSQTGATWIYLNPVDADGRDWTDLLAELGGGFVRVASPDDWILFEVITIEPATGYFRLQVAARMWGSVLLGAGNPFADGTSVHVTFDMTRTGGPVPVILGETTETVLESVIAALVSLKLVTDGR